MRGEHGQAAVETLVALTALFALAVLALQVLVWAAAAVELSSAASAAARAASRGDDAASAARAALPGPLRGGLRVEVTAGSGVRVSLVAPRLAPFVPAVRLADAAGAGRAAG